MNHHCFKCIIGRKYVSYNLYLAESLEIIGIAEITSPSAINNVTSSLLEILRFEDSNYFEFRGRSDSYWLKIDLVNVLRLRDMSISQIYNSTCECEVRSNTADTNNYKLVDTLSGDIYQLISFAEENRYARFIKILNKKKFLIDAIQIYI